METITCPACKVQMDIELRQPPVRFKGYTIRGRCLTCGQLWQGGLIAVPTPLDEPAVSFTAQMLSLAAYRA